MSFFEGVLASLDESVAIGRRVGPEFATGKSEAFILRRVVVEQTEKIHVARGELDSYSLAEAIQLLGYVERGLGLIGDTYQELSHQSDMATFKVESFLARIRS